MVPLSLFSASASLFHLIHDLPGRGCRASHPPAVCRCCPCPTPTMSPTILSTRSTVSCSEVITPKPCCTRFSNSPVLRLGISWPGRTVVVALAGLDVDVLGAQQVGGADGGHRIDWDGLQAGAPGSSISMRTRRLGSLEPESAMFLTLPIGMPFKIDGSAVGQSGGVAHVGVER